MRRIRIRRRVRTARLSKSFHTNLIKKVSGVEQYFFSQQLILLQLLNGALDFSVKQQENWNTLLRYQEGWDTLFKKRQEGWDTLLRYQEGWDTLLKHQEGWDKLLKDQDEKWDNLLNNQDGYLKDQRAHWVIQKAHWADHKAYWEDQKAHTKSLDSHLTEEGKLWTKQTEHMKEVGDNWTKLDGQLENICTKLASGETGFARNFYQSTNMVIGNTVNTFAAMLGVWFKMTPHLTTEEKKERTYVMIASGLLLVAFLIALHLVFRVQRSGSDLLDNPWYKFFRSSSFSLALLAPLLIFKALAIPGFIPACVLFVAVVLSILAPHVDIDIW